MGFLDHSTNNIILDAVLTDVGRQFLARNDGSFSIHKFALGDDEVNYSIVKKYGRTVGREKIEKNTPIFEAITNQAYSQKFKLISIPNPHLTSLPSIELVSGNFIALTKTENTKTVSLEQRNNANQGSIDPWLEDKNFIVELNNLFVQVVDAVPENVDAYQRATYILRSSTTLTSNRGAKLDFTLKLNSITDAMFDVYGSSNKTKIKTYMKVTGTNSGAVKEILLEITK